VKKMGLKKITRVREYVDFNVDGKMFRAYEITFTTEKTEGEFKLDIPVKEYTPEKAKDLATVQAIAIDKAVG